VSQLLRARFKILIQFKLHTNARFVYMLLCNVTIGSKEMC
jgi:hypothetical protein